jgi:hypothetical protein
MVLVRLRTVKDVIADLEQAFLKIGFVINDFDCRFGIINLIKYQVK